MLLPIGLGEDGDHIENGPFIGDQCTGEPLVRHAHHRNLFAAGHIAKQTAGTGGAFQHPAHRDYNAIGFLGL